MNFEEFFRKELNYHIVAMCLDKKKTTVCGDLGEDPSHSNMAIKNSGVGRGRGENYY